MNDVKSTANNDTLLASTMIMTKDEAYCMAIDIIANQQLDYREICVALAKMDPAFFVRLASSKPVHLDAKKELTPNGIQNIISFVSVGNRVAAIRELRSETDASLKDAKDVIDLAAAANFDFQAITTGELAALSDSACVWLEHLCAT